jgi:hypothetical protein
MCIVHGMDLSDITPEELEARAAECQVLLRELIISTHRKDKAERRRCTELLDAYDWLGVSVVLAAATQIAVERHKDAINVAGREEWVKLFAAEMAQQHSDWMRVQAGQIAGMLRSTFGNIRLALTVNKPTRCRLQATMVQYLIADSLEFRDVFEDELDEVLEEATTLASRRAFLDEFEGD